ncbi:MAG: transcriptional regulator [Ignavibacteriaceae bacterium]|nr:MAG: transcriptional regulator [Ignavibacteriaceae bacterium]
MSGNNLLEKHLLINPFAGNGKGKKFAGLISKSPLIRGLSVVTPPGLEESERIVNELNRDSIHLIIAGGDGTFNTVINQVHPPYRFSVSFVAAGSGNDLARFLGLPTRPIEALQSAIAATERILLDVWELKIETADGETYRKKFINTSGVGFDAYVGYLKQKKKFLSGLSVYVISLVQALVHYKPVGYSVSVNGEIRQSGSTMFITTGNGAYSGGGFKLTPRADSNDSLADICIVEHMPFGKILVNLPKAITGKHLGINEVTYFKSNNYTISLTEPAYIHLDGEVSDKLVTGLSLFLSPHKLKVIL